MLNILQYNKRKEYIFFYCFVISTCTAVPARSRVLKLMKRKWGIGAGCVNVDLVFLRARSCCLESWWHKAEIAPSYCNSFSSSRLSTMEGIWPQIIWCSPNVYQFVPDIKDLLKAFSHFHCWKSELHQCSLSKMDSKILLTTGKNNFNNYLHNLYR